MGFFFYLTYASPIGWPKILPDFLHRNTYLNLRFTREIMVILDFLLETVTLLQ